jgi:hypothetical protein
LVHAFIIVIKAPTTDLGYNFVVCSLSFFGSDVRHILFSSYIDKSEVLTSDFGGGLANLINHNFLFLFFNTLSLALGIV